jgi:hypothetical protein
MSRNQALEALQRAGDLDFELSRTGIGLLIASLRIVERATMDCIGALATGSMVLPPASVVAAVAVGADGLPATSTATTV